MKTNNFNGETTQWTHRWTTSIIYTSNNENLYPLIRETLTRLMDLVHGFPELDI
jgi:hypothetical protein